MRHVWRLERKGQGAFTSGLMDDASFNGKHSQMHRSEPNSRPTPLCEGENGSDLNRLFTGNHEEYTKYVFGFVSIKQYKKWCNSKFLRKDIALKGGELKKYRIHSDLVVRGNWQCAFKKDRAECVETRLPTNV